MASLGLFALVQTSEKGDDCKRVTAMVIMELNMPTEERRQCRGSSAPRTNGKHYYTKHNCLSYIYTLQILQNLVLYLNRVYFSQ